jgi:GNAT superfamily N-acetyltransferase
MSEHPPPRRADGRLPVTITYLEMKEPPTGSAPDLPAGTTMRRAAQPTVSFYRYLYDTVGEPWLWGDRRRLAPEELLAVIRDPAVEIFVLYVAGVPAGYVELDRRQPPDVEIAYFGLLPEFIGRGLGRLLLAWAVDRAWSSRPARVWLHTCTLDHPRALSVYQRGGFSIYRRETIWWDDPRADGTIQAGWR